MRNIIEEQRGIMVKNDTEFQRTNNLCKKTFGIAKELLEAKSELKRSLFHKQKIFAYDDGSDKPKVNVKIWSNADIEKTKEIYITIGEEPFVVFKDGKNKDRYNIRITWSELAYVGDEDASSLLNALQRIKKKVVSSKL